MKNKNTEKRRKEVIEVLKVFKEMNAWQGTIRERMEKFVWLHIRMNKIYHKKTQLAFCVPMRFKKWYSSGFSFFNPTANCIILQGRLSLITYLHEYGHALGLDQVKTQAYAVGLFKDVFPEKYNKLNGDKSFLVREK